MNTTLTFSTLGSTKVIPGILNIGLVNHILCPLVRVLSIRELVALSPPDHLVGFALKVVRAVDDAGQGHR